MKNLLSSAALAVGLSIAPVSAENNNTSPESKELNPSVLTLKSSVKDQTSLALDILKGQEITAKQIREYLISLGINPKELPWVQIVENNYTPGQFQNSINTQDLGLWEETPFNVENISSKFEEVLKKINEFQTQNDSQEVGYIQGDWTQRFAELSPNEDEVDVLNALISQLPETVKPLPIANALTWVIALNKYKDQNISELSEAEKVILISNVYAVVSVLDPQKVEGTVSLVLPAGLDVKGQKLESPKTYPSINVDEQVFQMIADLWVDLPIEMVNGFQDIYKEYQTILADMKQEAFEKIAKIDSKMEGVTDDRKLQRGEKIKQMILAWVTKVDEWFQSLSTTKKMFTLEYLNAWLKFTDKKNKDNLLDNSIDAVHVTINEEWNDLTLNRIWANADYLINKWVPQDQVDEIFHAMLNVRLEESKVALEESKVALEESKIALEESKKRWEKLDNILVMQKQILEARNKFKRNDSYASL